MKTPKKKEVVKYFENAKEVESVFGNKFILGEIYMSDLFGILGRVKGKTNVSHTIWDPIQGYAKILSYKEPKEKKPFGYFKSDILEAIEKAALNKELFYVHGIKYVPEYEDDMPKEAFPELFETKLTVGKWYWRYNKKELAVWNSGKDTYGFNSDFRFLEHYSFTDIDSDPTEATEQEVTEALTKEARRLGFKQGVYIHRPFWDDLNDCFIDKNNFPRDMDFYYDAKEDYLECYGFVVYSKGQWAEILETISKHDAEKLLNKKIV